MGKHTVDGQTLSPRMQELANRIGQRMAALRKGQGLSQEAVSARAGLSLSYVSMLERGTRMPHLGVLDSVAKVLGTDMVSLLMEETEGVDPEGVHKVKAFLQIHALTSAEVDKLLALARLMFPHRPGEPT